MAPIDEALEVMETDSSVLSMLDSLIATDLPCQSATEVYSLATKCNVQISHCYKPLTTGQSRQMH